MIRILMLAALAAAATVARAEILLLDPTFATGGIYTPRQNEGSRWFALPSGRVLVGGEFGYSRLDIAGVPDGAYGQGGVAPFPTASVTLKYRDDPVRQATVTLTHFVGEAPGGEILLQPYQLGPESLYDQDADGSSTIALVARIKADGSLDTTFGEGGVAKVRRRAWNPRTDSCRGNAAFESVLFDSDGSMYLVGYSDRTVIEGDFDSGWRMVAFQRCALVIKLDANGRIVPGFGENGVVQASGLKLASASGARFAPDGSILVTGVTYAVDAFPTDYGRGLAVRTSRLFRIRLLATSGAAIGVPETSPVPVVPAENKYDGLYLRYSPLQDRWIGFKGYYDYIRRRGHAEIHLLQGNGKPVGSFANGGHLITPLRDLGAVLSVGLTATGGVFALLADFSGPEQERAYRLMLCRWHPDGSIDASLGKTGCARAATPTPDFYMALGGSEFADGTFLGSVMNVTYQGEDLPLRIFRAVRLQVSPDIVETYNAALDRYVLSYDTGATMEAGWKLTGAGFGSGGTGPVCHLQSAPNKYGAVSHYYTIDSAECALLKSTQGWTYVGTAFHATPTTGDACPPPLVPVERFRSSSRTPGASGYRYVADASLAAPMLAKGWTPEGTAFCARP